MLLPGGGGLPKVKKVKKKSPNSIGFSIWKRLEEKTWLFTMKKTL
jgi:hypothetical protein